MSNRRNFLQQVGLMAGAFSANSLFNQAHAAEFEHINLIKKDLINEIPENEFYNATDLINQLIKLNRVVITYPILGYWLDVGKHEDYIKAQEDIKHIVF